MSRKSLAKKTHPASCSLSASSVEHPSFLGLLCARRHCDTVLGYTLGGGGMEQTSPCPHGVATREPFTAGQSFSLQHTFTCITVLDSYNTPGRMGKLRLWQS